MKQKPLRFRPDGGLTIMQVSDPQDLHFVRRAMIQMLNAAYDLIRPDLVVFTGDNILGNHLNDARFGNRRAVFNKEETFRRMRRALAYLLDPLDRRGIPFAFVYGNHDDMNAISKERQATIYERYPGLRGLNRSDPRVDIDTFNLPIYGSDGKKIVFNLWMLDSAGHDDDGENAYTCVSEPTVRWYVETSERLKRQNGGRPVPSLMFQHIPVPEITGLLEETEAADPTAVAHGEKFYRLNPHLARGTLGEYPHPCAENFGQFEAVVGQGDVLAMVFGHDHRNNFAGRLRGVDLIQTSCASFRCYGGRLRGVRVFELDEKQPDRYRTYCLAYDELMGRGLRARLRFFWDADEMEKKKAAALKAGAALLAAGAAAAAALLLRRKR